MRLRTLLAVLAQPLVGAALGTGALALTGEGAPAPAPRTHRFVDVARAKGILTRQPVVLGCGHNAAGLAWGDVEGDGDLDLFVPRQAGPSQLWVQADNGRFRERAQIAALDLTGVATTAAFADYDEDGDQDLYVGAAGPDQLFMNDGRGSFSDITPLSGTHEPGPAMSVSWADFDVDGRLDLLVANGTNCAETPQGSRNTLYRNLGGGRFADATRRLPPAASGGITLDGVWGDFDANGDQDLYLGNDNLDGQENVLVHNSGGRLVDRSHSSGAGISRFTMGVAAGDLDGDGRLDLAATDIGREALLLQVEPGRFEEQAEERGFGSELSAAGRESITWGIALADFDNDSDLDAYSAGGALGTDPQPTDDFLYMNGGGGHFRPFRVPVPGSGRTVAAADWDRDGDVDLAVAQLDGPLLLLEQPGAPDRRWIELVLLGRRSPREACGAVVRAIGDGKRQTRVIDCRGGARIVHFGLGDAPRADEILIRWPSGTAQTLRRLDADRIHTVREPT